MKKFFQPNTQSQTASIGLLLVRLVMGIAFILHGWGKIQSPFAWMPGSTIPGVFLFLAALSEFGGGIALVLGCLTSLASLGLAGTMAVAVYFHAIVFGDPFVSKGGGSYELGLLYFALSIMFLLVGPGRFSVDKFIFGEKNH
jgi:putative oxidoreductase